MLTMSSYPLSYDELLLSPSHFTASYERCGSSEPSIVSTASDDFPFLSPFSPTPFTPTPGALIDRASLTERQAASPSLAAATADDRSFNPFSSVWAASEPTVFPSLPAPTQRQPSASNASTSSGSSNASHSPPSLHSSLHDLLPPVKRRRKRGIRAMAREQRLAQHREVDAARRQKESDAIARLHLLVKHHAHEQQLHGAGEGRQVDKEGDEAEKEKEDDDEAAGADSGRVSKLAVLEASIALIEQLTAARSRVEQPRSAKDARAPDRHSATASEQTASTVQPKVEAPPAHHSSASPSPALPLPPWCSKLIAVPDHSATGSSSSFPLSVMPPPTSLQLAHSDRSATIHRAGLVSFSATHCVCVVGQQGVILAVNDRFVQCTGFRRSELVDTLLDARFVSTGRRLSPLIGRLQRHSNRMEPLLQYPTLVHHIEALWRGELRRAYSAVRGMRSDGAVMESRTTFWGEYDDQQQQQQQQEGEEESVRTASKVRLPSCIVGVFSIDDSIVVTRGKG